MLRAPVRDQLGHNLAHHAAELEPVTCVSTPHSATLATGTSLHPTNNELETSVKFQVLASCCVSAAVLPSKPVLRAAWYHAYITAVNGRGSRRQRRARGSTPITRRLARAGGGQLDVQGVHRGLLA